MNSKELLEYHKQLCGRGLEIMEKKNNDYAGSSGTTPFANFQATEHLGISSTEKGILTRMLDKMMRLSTFCNDGKLAVENESFEDACLDIINYSVLLAAYIRSEKSSSYQSISLRGGDVICEHGFPHKNCGSCNNLTLKQVVQNLYNLTKK